MARRTAHPGGVTAGQHSFSVIPSAEIQRSVFDRSSSLMTAFDSGFLIPIYWDEALPGDTVTCRLASFVRMATPIYPVMDNIFMDFFFFAIPYRLVWDNWQKFNGEQRDPGDSTDYLVPQFVSATVAEGSLSDFFGLPLAAGLEFNSLHHRAYNLCWNEWFRDQNLQDSVVVDLDDGPDTLADYVPLRRGKRHDYFSSSLPFPQKGDPVSLPLGTTAPVVGIGVPTFQGTTGTMVVTSLTGAATNAVTMTAGPGSAQGPLDWEVPNLVANLSGATAATINQLREAFQVQRLLERDARGGSRYTEIIRSHFGVVSPDARLQRPEYLGGGSVPITIHPVARTLGLNQSAGTPPIAHLGGFGTATARGVGFMKSFTEHTLLIGLVNVRADLRYQQGMNRMWSRQTRYDFYWPAFAHLGEQAVLSKEIFADGSAGDETVWGYQERYAEYRYKPSVITSRMRSTSVLPLDQWHLGMEFATRPLLNDVFIVDAPPMERVVAVTTEPEFFGDFYFSERWARPMPTFSVPGLIDHF